MFIYIFAHFHFQPFASTLNSHTIRADIDCHIHTHSLSIWTPQQCTRALSVPFQALILPKTAHGTTISRPSPAQLRFPALLQHLHLISSMAPPRGRLGLDNTRRRGMGPLLQRTGHPLCRPGTSRRCCRGRRRAHGPGALPSKPGPRLFSRAGPGLRGQGRPLDGPGLPISTGRILIRAAGRLHTMQAARLCTMGVDRRRILIRAAGHILMTAAGRPRIMAGRPRIMAGRLCIMAGRPRIMAGRLSIMAAGRLRIMAAGRLRPCIRAAGRLRPHIRAAGRLRRCIMPAGRLHIRAAGRHRIRPGSDPSLP